MMNGSGEHLPVLIVRLGTTPPPVKAECGTGDQWIGNGLGLPVHVVDPREGEPLPAPDAIAGAVLTGSRSMVTDREPWSEYTAGWLRTLVEREVPVLGICFGHHLLAEAFGGGVGFHEGGREVGTVTIRPTLEAAHDPLFGGLPAAFPAQAIHKQQVQRLPSEAVLLATGDFEPTQAYRLGSRAWGVQFHPEFSDRVMGSFIRALEPALQEEGLNTAALQAGLQPSPEAWSLLRRFAGLTAAER